MILRLSAAAILLLQLGAVPADDAPAPEPKHFRYTRPLTVEGTNGGQACATLDAGVFAHAASGSLNDLRLYANGTVETPFTLTESGTRRVEPEPASVRNLGTQDGNLVFDLAMPHRPYTAVNLDLAAKDFFATAHVSGSDGRGGAPVELGSFALFDLSAQHLSRFTTLPLQETTFAELHVVLHITASPGSSAHSFGPEIVRGATVPPSREAQTLFTPVATVSSFVKRGHQSLATVHLPAHVPVERIAFALDPAFEANFLRTVNITARPDNAQDTAAVETLSGEISRVQLPTSLVRDEGDATVEKLHVDAALGADLRQGATVELAVENGDDPPLPLRSAELEMRERRLCFDAVPASTYTLMYGDSALQAPRYDYARLFVGSPTPIHAVLADEVMNPVYVPRVDSRPYSERHPELLWVALIAAVAVLGMLALRSTRRHHS